MQGGERSSAGSHATGSGGDEGGIDGTALTPCPEGRGLFALSVSAGEDHACAVQYDTGELYCWGLGQSGQLGNGDTQSSSVPVKVQSDEQFTEVSVGTRSTCARAGLGDLYCFGDNFDGQLADETTQGRSLPVLTLSGTSQVAMSSGYVLAAAAGNVLFAWGSNTNGQLGLGDATTGTVVRTETETALQDVELVSAGYTHACLIAGASGFGFCAGSNQDSRLGLPGAQRTTFTQISPLGLEHISAGYDRTCAITSQGVLQCWGRNLPVTFAGLPEDVPTPRQVGKVEDWQRVSVGFDHVCGTTTDLNLVCAGDNSQGELGVTGASSPAFVAPDPPFRSLNFSAGRHFTCAIREPDFAVVCFGSNEHGKLGRGSSDESPGVPALVCLPP
jgi:alpha-tubulin suppressor-like RCC1 family protein